MDHDSESVKRILSKYKFRDLATEELQKVNRVHPDVNTVTGTYTFSDGSQKDLLKLVINIPVKYKGCSYNLPIQLWLLDSFPFTPPICLLRPTATMMIREGKHVDARGRIYLPALHNWDYVRDLYKLSMVIHVQNHMPLKGMIPRLSINFPNVYKVSVIGGGDLGIAAVLSIMAKGCVNKLVLIDIPQSSTKGGTMDLEIFSLPNVEVSKDLAASAGSRVVVFTMNAWSEEQSYVSVVQTNVDMYRQMVPVVAQLSPAAVLVVASQPVEIMTHVAWRQSCFSPTHVIGVGCNLDSQRLAHILNIALVTSSTSKQAWVIGELSDNKGEFTLLFVVSTKPLIDRAFEILKGKGQRSWSVGLSIADITYSILTDQRKTHSITTLAQGWGGIGSEVFLSLPCVLGANGSTRLAGVTLSPEYDAKLRESATSLSNFFVQLRI
uniref:UEV domain-containing protein n=1 Tax=Electrophorus electricus TaxID=8005 RepID=A0AAY5EF68_ELEEL